MTYIDVRVHAKFTGRKYYTYKTSMQVEVGQIVLVPYGKTNRPGIVASIVKKPTFDVKDLSEIYPYILPLQSQSLNIWLESYYPYDYGDLAGLFIPSNLNIKSRPAKPIDIASNVISDKLNYTEEQKPAIISMLNNPHVLLHGDTGTGKTEAFLAVAEQVLSAGKSVLINTPEIGLTPQLENAIKNRLSSPVFITHSQMTPAKRKQVWLAAYNNTTPALFIGPRSSIFLPYQNLGLIVADESHDTSYTNQQTPKYNGLYVASQLAKLHKAHFVQSSATPNTTDYYYAAKLGLPIIRMVRQAAGDSSVSGLVVDMSDKDNKSPYQLLSKPLLKAIDNNLDKNMQSLLFINRRGSARIIQCLECGFIAHCPTCNLPLTYHHDIYKNKCHQCGYTEPSYTQCKQCQSPNLTYKTPGTKGVVTDLQKLYPKAKIARFDLDTEQANSLHRQFKDILDGKFDIIIGTQLITKGLDLPKLSLVGVLNADASMQLPDYHAEERTFQQLYQVSGRVGRGHSKDNNFILQTYQPEHPVIKTALDRNWQAFYNYEISKRKSYGYPPFRVLAIAKITLKNQTNAINSAQKLKDKLSKYKVTILGPSPAFYEQTNQGYTWQLLIKSSSRVNMMQALLDIPNNWYVDIDPTSTL
jgi:primosomal protein N' (replication factor Y) (superfamily II helicase)